MNIIIVSDLFPPFFEGGAEKIALGLSLEYQRKGHKVFVFTVNRDIKIGNIKKINYLNLEIFQFGFNYNEKFHPYIGSYNPYLLRKVSQVLEDFSFNVAHIHNVHKFFSYSIIGLLEKKGIKIYHTAHDALAFCHSKFIFGASEYKDSVDFHYPKLGIFIKSWKRYNPLRSLIIKSQLKKVEKIVCVSKELEKLFLANGYKNTTTIYNGVESSTHKIISRKGNKLTKYKKNKIILFPGRLSNEKGLIAVIKLMDGLLESNLKVKIIFAGKDINFDSKYHNTAVNLGWVSQNEMIELYQVADLTIVPSIYLDPFPTVVIESLSYGTPVIVSTFSGGKEAIQDGFTGYIINPFRTDEFIQKVVKFLEEDDKKKMSSACKQYYNQNFKLSLTAKRYLDLLNDN